MKPTPLSERVISHKTPYWVQCWNGSEWVNLTRRVNLDKAILAYYQIMEQRRKSFSGATVARLNKQKPIRLYDTLYNQVIADKDIMTRASMKAGHMVKSWDLAALNALKQIISEKRSLH